MSQNRAIIALDVGEKRIGVAVASGQVAIAVPLMTIDVDGNELDAISRTAEHEGASVIVVGYPRNQSGEVTAQTAIVETFAHRLKEVSNADIVFQDESLTSVQAEERLKSYNRPYARADIDALAASLILQDYLESNK